MDPRSPGPAHARRVGLAAVAGVFVLAALFVVGQTAPTYATFMLESGRELSLPSQIYIATGNIWARYGVFLTLGFVLLLGAWGLLGRPEKSAGQ